MAANKEPIFTGIIKNAVVQVSVANANLDGTGTLVDVVEAGTNGSRVEKILIKAIATTTAGMIRLFLHDGANSRLIKEVPVTAITASATVEAFSAEVTLDTEGYILLANGYKIQAATENAETFNVISEHGDY